MPDMEIGETTAPLELGAFISEEESPGDTNSSSRIDPPVEPVVADNFSRGKDDESDKTVRIGQAMIPVRDEGASDPR